MSVVLLHGAGDQEKAIHARPRLFSGFEPNYTLAPPDIPHERNKFLKGLNGRGLQITRQSGSWENWLHDTAVIKGPGRHCALVGLTEHPKGDDYLADLAPAVHEKLQ